MSVHTGFAADPPASPDLWLRPRNLLSSIRMMFRFDPDVVYVRPTLRPLLFSLFTLVIVLLLRRPVIVHIMDHEEGVTVGVGGFVNRFYARYLRWLVNRARSAFTISPGMQADYEARFGRSMPPVANAVTVMDSTDVVPLHREDDREGLLLGYFGSLDAKMNRDSVRMIAGAVERLNDRGFAVRLNIFTRPLYLEYAHRSLDTAHVHTRPYLPVEQYREQLNACDALLIAYNFDAESVAYCRFSIANKLADYLSAGKEVIVVGPLEVETVALCQSFSIGQTITDSADLAEELGSALRHLGQAEFAPARAAAMYAQALRSEHGLNAWRSAFETVSD